MLLALYLMLLLAQETVDAVGLDEARPLPELGRVPLTHLARLDTVEWVVYEEVD